MQGMMGRRKYGRGWLERSEHWAEVMVDVRATVAKGKRRSMIPEGMPARVGTIRDC